MDKGLALVTGASGFVGTHVMRRLAPTGRPLRAIYRTNPPRSRDEYPNVTWIEADIATCDFEPLVREVSTVFHVAGVPIMSSGPDETTLMNRVNTEATLRLAEASRRAGVRQFIFVSSVDAGEQGATPELDEQHGEPVRAYGRSKRQAETALLAMSGPGFAVTILRPSVLFGEDHLGSVHDLARSIARGRFALIGRGHNRMNFYYIADFMDVLTAVEGNPAAAGELFIAADRPQTVREFTTALAGMVNPGFQVRAIPRVVGVLAGAVFDVAAAVLRRPMPLSLRRVGRMTRDLAYSNAKLARVLNLLPRIGWREGLRRTTDWYRSQGLL
jgi:nucleoside-diphosphate-sugar epimerase